MPKAASITTMASSNSQACACTWVPTRCAFRKYSSLWMTTRKTSEATATEGETLRLRITMIDIGDEIPDHGEEPHDERDDEHRFCQRQMHAHDGERDD